MIIDVSGVPLTPGNFGRDCLGNGEHIDEGYACCCDECDYGQCCNALLYDIGCRDCPHEGCPRFGETQEILGKLGLNAGSNCTL